MTVNGARPGEARAGPFDESGGTLVRVETRRNTAFVWFDRSGKQIAALSFGGDIRAPAMAPDDRRIALERANTETGAREIWVLDGDREHAAHVW